MKFTDYAVELTLTESMLGTIPTNKTAYADFIATRAATAEMAAEETSTVPEPEIQYDEDGKPIKPDKGQAGHTTFHVDEDGPFIYDYMVRGMLKNAGNILKAQVEIKNLRSKIDMFVFVLPRKIRFDTIGPAVSRSLRAQTAQGPRVTVVQSDTCAAGTVLKFKLRILESPEISEKTIRELLSYGELCGLGQFRNGSYGRFTYEMKVLAS